MAKPYTVVQHVNAREMNVMSPEVHFKQLMGDTEMVLDKLDHWAESRPAKVFIHYGESGQKITFAAFKEVTDRLAAGLAANGIKPGDNVSVLTRDSLLCALSMFGIWRAGAVFAPINFNFKGSLLFNQINDAAPAALITDTSFYPVLSEVGSQLVLRKFIVREHLSAGPISSADECLPGREILPFEDLLNCRHAVPAIRRGPLDIANIVYTSGTTGPSKGVVQRFRWMNQFTYLTRMILNEDDVLYCDLPLYHVGGAFQQFVRALWHGNTVGLWDRFSPNRFWDRIAECGATVANLMDVMIPWLMAASPRPDDRKNTLSKVHMQPLPDNHHQFARRFGIDFVTTGYGQTELGLGFFGVIDEFGEEEGTPKAIYRGLRKEELRQRQCQYGRLVVDGSKPLPKGYMGTPSPFFDLEVFDEADFPVVPGTMGELVLRPRFPGLLLKEYFGRLDATLEAFDNCWYHTGDACARLPGEDRVHVFLDRIGGFFRVRGENVSSFEIESVLNEHPAVRISAAIPMPAAEGDEEDIAVAVELEAGATLSEDELRAYATKSMPKYMVPRHIWFVETMPLTATNKIEKYKIKQGLYAQLGLQPRTSSARKE